MAFSRILLLSCVAMFCAVLPPEASGQYLPPSVLQAAESARMGNASRGQRALLFKYNDAINEARMGGWIPDATYQAAQQEYASLNREFAKIAAESTGAEFTVQQSTSQTYSPGTDSDYIVKTNSGDPVGDIQTMQSRYNDHVNSYLEDALVTEGFEHTPRDNWHNRLDVDFMADPANVTDEQFRQIAKLNNDAYKRRGAAEFERRSRMGGVEVTPDQFADYANEMQDFIDKKQTYLDKIQSDPTKLTDPQTMVEHHRLMAQEQKYTSRIQDANRLLREQEGLPVQPKPKGPPVYEMHPDGRITKRPVGTLAQQGAKRGPMNRTRTAIASGVAQNSVQQAVTELSESMAEAAAKNPTKWPNSQQQIAQVADRLPPAAKGQLLERVAARREAAALEKILSEAGELDDAAMQAARTQARKIGNDYSRGVAHEMQERVRASRPSLAARTDNALKTALGVTDDMSQLRGVRGAVNRRLANAMGGMEKIGMLGTALEVAQAVNSGYSAFSNLAKARDPNLTAAEMRELHRQAAEDLGRLGKQGMLAGVSYALPTVGAVIGGYDMGYAAGRYVLENTALGRALDAAALEGFDTAFQAWEELWDRATNQRGAKIAADAEQRRKLEEAYWRALREGRIKMKPGVTITDFLDRLRAGDLAALRGLFEPGPNASQETIDRFANKPTGRKDPNDDLEWINQTFEPEQDTIAREEYERLVAEGSSPIGPVVNPDREEGIATSQQSAEPDYRARAEHFLRRTGKPASSIAAPDYRRQAEQIHTRVVAAEQERERQARIAEAQRQEMIRRQQIAAQQARARQIAAQHAWAQQQAYARQQQIARQQAAWSTYLQAQRAMQQWQQSQRTTPESQMILGRGYTYPSSQGYSGGYRNQSVSEADYYNSSENGIYWGKQ